MAGVGRAPKDPSKRARRNVDPIPLRAVVNRPVSQPDLPGGVRWPEQTLRWWQHWGESPLSTEFSDIDWDFMLDAAILHSQLWNGDTKVAAELRLRVAKFGATPEDRARLRIQFVQADEAEDRRDKKDTGASARARRGPLKSA